MTSDTANMKKNSPIANFTDLGLISPLLTRLTELKYQQATPIQAQAIPSILAGRDVIAGANTGSGKTAAFALPILQKLSLGKHLYIDDFVTDKSVKSTDAGKALLDFLKIYAKQQDCRSIELDSLVQRYDAHKFYLSQDMQIVSHHFSFQL